MPHLSCPFRVSYLFIHSINIYVVPTLCQGQFLALPIKKLIKTSVLIRWAGGGGRGRQKINHVHNKKGNY